jgi:hypothetical protein
MGEDNGSRLYGVRRQASSIFQAPWKSLSRKLKESFP